MKITSLLTTNKKIIIKKLSIFLMIAALILQLINFYLVLSHQEMPWFWVGIIEIASVALFIHLLEGIVAFFWALSKRKNPFKYGLYSFFTGTISLLELFDNKS
ncbi:conserved hypothetical protein (plasmid) [Gloeothece citriformis PCC 7424]|uniref:DUF1145 domain-containing protein n=1 Tax=Gloeothece citriformis (strain PCC 7424) TaxID=65393 RepID=B7KMD2_GLOC7|nr:hypothetical protein [Gloeothece citriformis]ACK73954.1 conserved hypothetical protein [Gloeothece citriformis PCC 7424]